ncbi:hypothetical protein GCM10010347_29370 [Streptomyces cirratus]|uniref:Uncharacterized protein n=1 Tax=Streptomyces cirratus TaxID=68187 RepID=A0ABQ3EWJ9_9ACTN|nr:hypothetical protein [Streptomyces cirratus]GHB57346.1 hypothetical protein GCM10010347_29370 [Streptomyces cirratus]
MPDPHTAPPTLRAAPGTAGARPAPLPPCPVCAGRAERISWRGRPGEPLVLVFDPCGHHHAAPSPPLLVVAPGTTLDI